MQTTMQTSEHSKPWHKHPLVWMMILIPFSAIIMGVIMIWLAVDTNDGLVADDYYKQGLAINDVISLDKKAAELGLSAVIAFDNSTRVINVHFDKGSLENYPKSLVLHLQHATHENSDTTVLLDHGIDDQYIGHLKKTISEGVWYFEIVDRDGSEAIWKINTRSHVREKNTIHLRSDY